VTASGWIWILPVGTEELECNKDCNEVLYVVLMIPRLCRFASSLNGRLAAILLRKDSFGCSRASRESRGYVLSVLPVTGRDYFSPN
jgi:hypothetical protein